MQIPEQVRDKLIHLPTSSGCYIFRGISPSSEKQGDVLYIGKAKNLRSRVRSYFQEHGSDTRSFIPLLHRVIGDLETIVTATEKEAVILENSLIKQHRPKYNIKLRDSKEFLSLRLDGTQTWPRLEVIRKPLHDKAKYFGPYPSASAARRSLHVVNKHFQLRTCTDQELASRRRPCLQYQIKRCPAPCVYAVDPEWYREQVHAVELFLTGRHDELSQQLNTKMQDASKAFEFELAAIYRDQIHAIETMRGEQRVVQTGAALHVSQDIIGLYREGDLAEVVVLYVRNGRVNDTASVRVPGAEVEDSELVSAFLTQHYGLHDEAGATPPDEIIVPFALEAVAGIEEVLSEHRSQTDRARVKIIVPQRGPRVQLLSMANENAQHAFSEKKRAQEDTMKRLEIVREKLRLPSLPRRIECCDISHLSGGDTVGAIVTLIDGMPAPKRYKAFHVRTVRDGDDYGAMYEVLARRFRRGREALKLESASQKSKEKQESSTWELPDLFVVDGGQGQLNIALAAARDLGLQQLAIVALAKEKTFHASLGLPSKSNQQKARDDVVDRVYLPGQKNPIELREHSAGLFFLARARDEAHRFANATREKLGTKKRMRSRLDSIAGLGSKVRVALLKTLGSMRAIEVADDETLLSVEGFTKRHLAALRKVVPTP